MPVFSGEYTSALDDKNRIIIPARLRQAAGPEGVAGYYVMRGIDDCIVIQTAARFEGTGSSEADSRIRQTAAGRMLERAIYSKAEFGKSDKQGRFLLPARLVQDLHLGRQVAIIGVNDRIEVWDPETWKRVDREAQAQRQKRAEEIYGNPKEA